LNFFEKAWGSPRTSIYILDIIPILELFRAQPIELVYPSDYYLLRDSANAANRSIYAYDTVSTADYAAVSRVAGVHAHDVVSPYDTAYTSRRNVVHAYDVITQADSAARSGEIALSVLDILRTSEWFFRVNKVLKILEFFILSELGTAFRIPVIYAEDSILYDISDLPKAVKITAALDYVASDSAAFGNIGIYALDSLGFDRSSYIQAKVVAASDYIGLDSAEYTRSYSPLFFTLFGRKIPITYRMLSVLDSITVADSASPNKYIIASVSDYGMVFDGSLSRNMAVTAYDSVASDSAVATAFKLVYALDNLATDSTSYTRSYSPLFFTLFGRRVPIRYMTLSVLDAVAVPDVASVIVIKTASVLDLVSVSDYADVKKVNISASDFIVYDSVPSINQSDIRYISLYANVGMRTISVFDRIGVYESVWVGPRLITVRASDRLVSDSASAVKRSVHAYEIIVIWENVNIVRR
jgi:hypothetical protein